MGVRPTFANKPVRRRSAFTPTLTLPRFAGEGTGISLPCPRFLRRGRAGGAAYSNGTIIRATMLMILMSGLIAGPAVSL